VFLSAAVNSLFIPWDFLLVLLFLGIIVPWRGARRMQRLLAKPDLSSSDRLKLYGSTIVLQWLLVAVIAALAARRSVEPWELGLAAPNGARVLWASVVLTAILCLNQIFGIRKILSLPTERRGGLFAISEKIMPRTGKETVLYALLAATAGISEEFIYRGFVFMCFVRMIANYGSPNVAAAVLSSAWFSVAHAYQGRRGIITTLIVGLIFAFTRIWTASIFPVVIAHFGMDLTIGICMWRLSGRPVENAR
jgi:uncharacterized protein